MTLDQGLLGRVRERLVAEGGTATPARVAAALRDVGGGLHGDVEVLQVMRALQSEIVGAGPLQPLLGDPEVTDVLVNAPDEIWVDRGSGLTRVAVRFADEAAVRRLAVRLAAPTGRRLDDAQPWVDARLPDGVRLHAVLPPVSPRGTCLSLRVPRRRVFVLDELVDAGSLPPDGRDLLRLLVASRTAFLISGGTGTGKTTLLSALLSLVPAGERLLLVEDAGELAPDHPHVVRLEARPANVEGAGEVTLRDLVRQALRMRPDRVVVGEVGIAMRVCGDGNLRLGRRSQTPRPGAPPKSDSRSAPLGTLQTREPEPPRAPALCRGTPTRRARCPRRGGGP